jgi:2-dehydro-3-deoxy-D-arabinonate dehydratase
MPPRNQIGIQLRVMRGSQCVYEGRTDVGQMARSFENLIEWLGRDNTFPQGVFLLTGTGIVPERSFSMQAGDRVDIEIDGIGCLSNPVVQG